MSVAIFEGVAGKVMCEIFCRRITEQCNKYPLDTWNVQ